MNKRRNWLALLLGLLLVTKLFANEQKVFSCDTQERDYDTLIKELRCMTCPNQSIADSQASVAKAMQDEIYTRLQAGESADDIRSFLLARYGDYIMYRPLVKKQTYVLWFGPAAMMTIAMLAWISIIRKRGSVRDC